MVLSADTTQDLERGYWPSYNVPYFATIYNATGYEQHAAMLAAKGPSYKAAVTGLSYQACHVWEHQGRSELGSLLRMHACMRSGAVGGRSLTLMRMFLHVAAAGQDAAGAVPAFACPVLSWPFLALRLLQPSRGKCEMCANSAVCCVGWVAHAAGPKGEDLPPRCR